MKKKAVMVYITLAIIFLVFILICFLRNNNKNIEENDIGFINADNFKNYEGYVYGLNDNINYEIITAIRNTKLPQNVRNTYNKGYAINTLNESDKISIIPNIYINEKIVCIIKNDLELKKGNIIKVSFLTDSRNPINLGYLYEDKAYTYVIDKTEDNIYEISISAPNDGTFVLALYNDGDISTCIMNGKIIIE